MLRSAATQAVRAVRASGRAAAPGWRAQKRTMTMSENGDGPTVVSLSRCFGGMQGRYRHFSEATGTEMGFSVFVPSMDYDNDEADMFFGDCSPYVIWLSGLTCDETNFVHKAGAQRVFERERLICVCPDTSPRGLGLPGEDDSYDFGSGAGFYLDATEAPWATNYRMDTYVNQELPEFIEKHFPVYAVKSIMGHSMGGHGALTSFLNYPGQYQTVSAFSPICNPSNSVWGRKALSGYLGADEGAWQRYDAARLLKAMADRGEELPKMLITIGEDDEFLESGQLRPQSLPTSDNIEINVEDGYDHSYYFISTFIDEHVRWHARALYNRDLY